MLGNDKQDTVCGGEKESIETEKMQAINSLLSDLNEGCLSGEQDGWLDADEVFEYLESLYHEKR